MTEMILERKTRFTDFKDFTLNQFNEKYGTELKVNMSIEQTTDHIETMDKGCFYSSYRPEDVLDAMNEEGEIVELLDIHLVNIEGLYIAMYV